MRMLVLGAGLQGSACAFDLLNNPAVERVMLPVNQWPTGAAMIDEVPYDDSASRS